jgi:folate-binding protein YgfZ
MQTPLTIENHLFPIHSIKEFHGSIVPFEVKSYTEDYLLSQKGSGFFDLSDWGIIEISGPDAKDYLQRMTTINFKSFPDDSVASGAFLTGRGGVVVLGCFRKSKEDSYLFYVSPNQTQKAIEHIEKFHFQEKLEVKDKTGELALLGLWNWKDVSESMKVQTAKMGESRLILWRDQRQDNLVWCEVPRNQGRELLLALHRSGFAFLGMHLFHFFRAESGLPWVGWEVADTDLILEANLEGSVARNKGCYPGQEVVERIFTYGQVNRKLLRTELFSESPFVLPNTPTDLKWGDQVIGQLMSVIADPGKAGRAVGLAYIKKPYWASKEFIRVNPSVELKIMNQQD